MTAAAAVVGALPESSPGGAVPLVFGAERVADAQAVRLAGLIDAGFVAECGWDAAGRVLAPPAGHRLLGWRQPAGGGELEVSPCAVPDCRRSAGPAGLCQSHRRGQLTRGMSVADYAAAPTRQALDRFGPCLVVACPRDRRGGRVDYCRTHAHRWLRARRDDPGLDEHRWRKAAAPIVVTGRASLAGVPPLVAAQVLYGLQQRTRAGAHTRIEVLRLVVTELRLRQARSIDELADDPPGTMYRQQRTILDSLARHARLAVADPEIERVKDVWDLAVFGLRGRLTFTTITQPWLREAAKVWAADEIPRRRGGGTGNAMRSYIGSIARLSESLRAHRDDRGDAPNALGRTDIESFLHRLGYLTSTGACSPESRTRICRDVKRILGRIRALGLTRAGRPATGLGGDFVLTSSDIPAEPERGEPGRDVPAQVMRQLCESLPLLERGPSGREIRLAVELLMDTGRRPEEILRLRWGCVGHDPDGSAVLVYDNHKRNRLGRRLPIGRATAELITAQQTRVRKRFPDTPIAGLALLPTPHANLEGRKPITGGLLAMRHRTWIDRLSPLRLDDGTEVDTVDIVPYSYRHSYAQRHADAGVGIDVLSELLDHRTLEVTRGYYRVGEDRRRAAVDTVTALSFDRHGNRLWRDAQALLDSEHARHAVGEVAVPYGRCTEPSNVKAGGGACPIRFRCAGCDHFRTDVSHLPDLTGYLDDLLQTRERLAATIDGVDEWARTDAMPTQQEITRIRRLINRINGDLTDLTAAEKSEINAAANVVRRHRAATSVPLGMPTIRTATSETGE